MSPLPLTGITTLTFPFLPFLDGSGLTIAAFIVDAVSVEEAVIFAVLTVSLVVPVLSLVLNDESLPAGCLSSLLLVFALQLNSTAVIKTRFRSDCLFILLI